MYFFTHWILKVSGGTNIIIILDFINSNLNIYKNINSIKL